MLPRGGCLKLPIYKRVPMSRLYLIEDDAKSPSYLQIIKSEPQFSEINRLLENMSLEEKYSIILQSYSSKVTSEGNTKDENVMNQMETLYMEMIANRISPDDKCTEKILNAAASFCNLQRITKAIRLLKKGGRLGGFGGVLGQLTTPVTTFVDSFAVTISIPTDNREKEVAFAIVMITATLGWLALQVGRIYFKSAYLYYMKTINYGNRKL